MIDIFKHTTSVRTDRLWPAEDMGVFPFISVTTHGILILQLERKQETTLHWPMYMNFYAVNTSSCNVFQLLSSLGNIFGETIHA